MKSRMFPKLHPENLNQLVAVLKHPKVKAAYIHGDGNIYHTKKMSDDRSIFHNDHPTNRGAMYRAEFTDYRDVPDTLEELEQMLIEAYQREESEKIAETYHASENNFVFSTDPEKPVVKQSVEATPLVSLPDPSVKSVSSVADLEAQLKTGKSKVKAAKDAEAKLPELGASLPEPNENA